MFREHIGHYLSMVRSQGMGIRGFQPLTYSQAYDRVLSAEAKNEMWNDVLITGATVLTGGAVLRVGYQAMMRNPAMVQSGVDFIGSYFPTGAPSVSWAGYGGASAGYFYGYEKFFGK